MESAQPPGKVEDMGQKITKSPKKSEATPATPSEDDLISDSSDDSPSGEYIQVAGNRHLQQVKDEDSACSLSYSNRSSSNSSEPGRDNVVDSASRLNRNESKEKIDDVGVSSLISDDESDPGGVERVQGDTLSHFMSRLRVNETNCLPSISPDSAEAQPSESFLTDDESDSDDHLVVNNRSLLESSPGRLPELSISARLHGDSISDISEDDSSESSDELSELDVSTKTNPPICKGGEPRGDVQSGDTSPIRSASPVVAPKPPVRTFYIPRENKIPNTKDATVKSTAYERIKRVDKSKIFSNVLTDATQKRVKSVERVWKSFRILSEISHWQKLLAFGEPLLMNFKLIELKSSYVSMIRKTTDIATCSVIFEVLGEITRSKFEAHKAELFEELASPHFIRNLYKIVEKCVVSPSRQSDLERFIENFVDIYEDIFLQLDALATDGLASDLEGLIGKFLALVERGDDQSCGDQLKQLLMIIESRDTLIRANSSYPFNVLKEESVESNIIDGPYDGVDQYLTIHYRLMKEDFQNSLREGVIDYMRTVNSKGYRRKAINYNLNVFKNVTLVSHLTSYAVKHKIMFYDQNVLARIRDPASPHFLTGSLLMLTNSHFQDYWLVRTEDRSPLEREQNYIFVSMVLGPPGLPQMVHFDVMAEPSRLFEPYYRVLNVVRSIDGNHFPFKRYIVDVETDVSPPAFMKPETKLKVGDYTCSLWENETWPAPENIGLNPVQLDGLKMALRNELAVIQGPPGTGKTYLSKRIIEILLQNKTLWHRSDDDGAGLIMVVCFKNQSLDQLLTGLIKDKVKVLRIGTQSKEEMLDAYNLKTLEDPKYSHIYKKMRWRLAQEQKEVIEDLRYSLEILEEITAHSGIFKFEYFSHLLHLDERNHEYLKRNYEQWLLQIPCDEPDFKAIEILLGEQSWTVDRNVDEQSDVYKITLQEMGNILERINAKLDVLKELGNCSRVGLLTSAATYLVQKLNFMEDKLRQLKCPMAKAQKKELHSFKVGFEGDSQPFIEELHVEQRWMLYKAWMLDLYEHHHNLIDSIVTKSRANSQRYVEIEELLNMRKIAQCDAEVVGLTTTAAAKYFKMMDCLKPKIVLVEEAAEVMEAHTVASLSKYCEHLILVGDHKQLRPLTSSHIIGKEAHLDYSLYERLVKNGFQPCTLTTQYRMRPDIADLIRPAVYKELFDDPSVSRYPDVLGINANLFFVDHTIREDETPDVVSRWNKHEAEFHLALCNYLVLQGYEPSQITVLATYSEQEKYFNKEKVNYPQLEDVVMATVDSFQGKENDIILLSLVRSNAEAVIGFLAQENRINVALSRAKVGLFITGNKSNLLAKGRLWTRVVNVLLEKNAIGVKLPLKCQIHGQVTLVAKPCEIKALKNGGCAQQCKAPLPCGHKCIHLCHPMDREHNGTYKCVTPCNMKMECSHRCTLRCHSANPRVFKCFCKMCSPHAKCDAPLPCGHRCLLMGHDEDIEHQTSHLCQTNCNTTLACGHICASLCHTEDREHVAFYRCPINCKRFIVCGLCLLPEKSHVLPCGHSCPLLCHSVTTGQTKCHICPNKSSTLVPSDESDLSGGVTESIPTMYFHKSPVNERSSGTAQDEAAIVPLKHPQDENNDKSSIVTDPLEFNVVDANQSLAKGPADSSGLHENTVRSGHTCLIKKGGGRCRSLCYSLLSCGHHCLVRCLYHKNYPHLTNYPHLVTDVCNNCSSSARISIKSHPMSTTQDSTCGETCDELQNKTGKPLKCLDNIAISSEICDKKFVSSKIGTDDDVSKIWVSNPLNNIPTIDRCSHHVVNYECDETCPGRPCGHPCSLGTLVRMSSNHAVTKTTSCQEKCKANLRCGHGLCPKSCHFGDDVHYCRVKKTFCVNSVKRKVVQGTNISDSDSVNLVRGAKHVDGNGSSPSENIPSAKITTSSTIGLDQSCQRSCLSVMKCRHRCSKPYHSATAPHVKFEKCSACLEFESIQQRFPTVEPEIAAVNACSHMVERYLCKEKCEDLLCGHRCSKIEAHLCSDIHEKPCRKSCSVLLFCEHKCAKPCHIGDNEHMCARKRCQSVNQQVLYLL